jgi:hypothetical protein
VPSGSTPARPGSAPAEQPAGAAVAPPAADRRTRANAALGAPNRVATVHAQTRPTLLAAAAFALAAPLAALLPHRTGSWLPLHLLFVGALLSAISGATQLLAVTWSAAPAPPARLVNAQRALIVLGAAGIAAGREAGDRLALLVPSGSAVVAALALLAVLLVGIRRRSVQGRFQAAIDHYLVALAAGVAACAAGVVLAGGWAASWGGEALVRLREAHLTTNLLGLVGLVIAGTVPFFAATQARVKLGPRLGVRAQQVVLAVLGGGLLVAVVGLASGHPLVTAAGLSAYVAGLAGMCALLPRLRAKQYRWAGARLIMLLAGIGWWVGCVAAAAGRAALGRSPFPEPLIGALAVGGYAQILVSSLAYLGPVLRGGDHRRLSEGFATTRSPVALVGLNVAAAGALAARGWLVGVALVAAGVDGAWRAVRLLASRPSRRLEPHPQRPR